MFHSNASFTSPTGEVYIPRSKIGAGSFGEVHLIDHPSTGRQLVMKLIPFDSANPAEHKEAKQEVDIMRLNEHGTPHPNIVRYFDSWFQTSTAGGTTVLRILMEYAPNGTLETYLRVRRDEGTRLPETEVMHKSQQLLSALHFCHTVLHVMHRDLKPENILLGQFGELKLADFGISKRMKHSNQACYTQAGTPLYMAPEMLDERPYSFAADVWSLGCVIYEMMALRKLWLPPRANSLFEIHQLIRTKDPDLRSLREGDRYSSQMCRMVARMINKDPARRLTTRQALDLFTMKAPPEAAGDFYRSVHAASRIQNRFRDSLQRRRATAGPAAVRAAAPSTKPAHKPSPRKPAPPPPAPPASTRPAELDVPRTPRSPRGGEDAAMPPLAPQRPFAPLPHRGAPQLFDKGAVSVAVMAAKQAHAQARMNAGARADEPTHVASQLPSPPRTPASARTSPRHHESDHSSSPRSEERLVACDVSDVAYDDTLLLKSSPSSTPSPSPSPRPIKPARGALPPLSRAASVAPMPLAPSRLPQLQPRGVDDHVRAVQDIFRRSRRAKPQMHRAPPQRPVAPYPAMPSSVAAPRASRRLQELAAPPARKMPMSGVPTSTGALPARKPVVPARRPAAGAAVPRFLPRRPAWV